MTQEFWVIGGQYRDLAFTNLIDGTSRVEGPFRSYSDAEHAWKRHTDATRSDAQTRFTIVTCASNPRRQQAA